MRALCFIEVIDFPFCAWAKQFDKETHGGPRASASPSSCMQQCTKSKACADSEFKSEDEVTDQQQQQARRGATSDAVKPSIRLVVRFLILYHSATKSIKCQAINRFPAIKRGKSLSGLTVSHAPGTIRSNCVEVARAGARQKTYESSPHKSRLLLPACCYASLMLSCASGDQAPIKDRHPQAVLHSQAHEKHS